MVQSALMCEEEGGEREDRYRRRRPSCGRATEGVNDRHCAERYARRAAAKHVEGSPATRRPNSKQEEGEQAGLASPRRRYPLLPS